MKTVLSDSCTVGNHADCTDPDCGCACHVRVRNHGPSPQEWKEYQARIQRAEEEQML